MPEIVLFTLYWVVGFPILLYIARKHSRLGLADIAIVFVMTTIWPLIVWLYLNRD